MVEFIFEDIDDNTVYHSSKSKITWKELKPKLQSVFQTERAKASLERMGIKKIEIGSIAWFHFRGKTRGRFCPLNTMFYARLLKR